MLGMPLDVLQRSEVDENFTRSTVEIVALRADEEVTQLKITVANRQRSGGPLPSC